MSIKKYVSKLYENLFLNDPRKKAEYLRKRGYRFGEHCEIFRSVTFGSEYYLVSLGNNVKLTTGVTFIPHDGSVYVLRNLGMAPDADLFGEVTVGNNVFIGNHAIILPNVHIGNNCVIGAGSVVTKDIPDDSIACGVPAKVISTIQKYFEKHGSEFDYTKGMTFSEKKDFLYKKYNIDRG